VIKSPSKKDETMFRKKEENII